MRTNTFHFFVGNILIYRFSLIPLSTKCSVSYCDHSPSVVRSHFLVYSLASTNINQSALNLVKIYVTIRSRMRLIMGLIVSEHLKLFAFALKKNCYISLCLHCSIYKYQQISTKLGQNIYDRDITDESVMGLIGREQLELFVLELEKNDISTLFTL